jgi:hypothetical protein
LCIIAIIVDELANADVQHHVACAKTMGTCNTINDAKEKRDTVARWSAHCIGKTTLARNLAHQALVHGHTVLFTSAGQLLGDLAALDSDSAVRRRLRHYAAPALLLINEVGYLSYSNRHADLLFELISRRYQRPAAAASISVMRRRNSGKHGRASARASVAPGRLFGYGTAKRMIVAVSPTEGKHLSFWKAS